MQPGRRRVSTTERSTLIWTRGLPSDINLTLGKVCTASFRNGTFQEDDDAVFTCNFVGRARFATASFCVFIKATNHVASSLCIRITPEVRIYVLRNAVPGKSHFVHGELPLDQQKRRPKPSFNE
jgi:hypothetical protein